MGIDVQLGLIAGITLAATLLMAGGLEALRTASLTTGLPISILLLVSGVGLLRALRIDASVKGVPRPEALHEGRPQRPEDAEPGAGPGAR